ncbi:iron-containing alcohol dehydrogenase [Azospirillum sp. INR13]|uniref:iron-containing alcohol dehydrogenase n=1 Tax=Azospirillum sp. INR13 TaxID=2596919 RepID=UPI0018923F4D|nr:iron-containing alcohol dehydrogenase [Azospirillum sp. INR13]MBF5093697.1 iron-containing alcohol dehydrogenase [Azospirillum sp. INR13]
MMDFVFETTPKLVCEAGAATRLGEMARELGIRRALIVTDAGLVAAGLLEPVEAGFRTAGTVCTLFSDVVADPPEQSVALAVQAARDAGADGVIGVGGGSSLDTAKLVALLAGTPQELPDIYGIGLAKGPRLPLIQVPTTAGTGSEVTPIAIVTTPSSEKKGVVSSLLYPDLAVLDAHLTLGLPPRVTAMTGIDAMVHAIEAYTTRHKKNPLSDSLALRALSLLAGNIRAVIAEGRDVAARAAMLQGSLLAGIAFANAPVGAVHALAYPLGGHFHVPHGLSNALMLGPVLEFNRPAAETLYAELAPAILPGSAFATPAKATDAFLGAMRDLVAAMPMEQRLEQVGVRRDDLPMLAADAMKVQRLLINNPREVSYDDALALYRQAY